jgi:hypothetical protein
VPRVFGLSDVTVAVLNPQGYLVEGLLNTMQGGTVDFHLGAEEKWA